MQSTGNQQNCCIYVKIAIFSKLSHERAIFRVSVLPLKYF